MKGFLRRLRGMIKTGLTWSVAWAGAFGVFGLVRSFALGFPMGIFETLVAGGAIGFVSGGVFAGILSLAEGKRTLSELSLKRVALWGAIGGMTLFALVAPRLLGAGLPVEMLLRSFMGPVLFTGLLGAGSAAGSVALARKADDPALGRGNGPDPFLLEDG